MEPDLFTAAAEERAEKDPAASPLAVRMRPRSLDEVVGQRHLLRPGSPLRRLVDRFTGEVCVALCAGEPVPEWARSALPDLPDLMAAAESRAKKYERAIIDLVEVSLLHDRVGDTFTGSVIDIESDGRKGVVMVADPAVQGRVRGDQLLLGSDVRLRLTSADWESGRVEFEVV